MKRKYPVLTTTLALAIAGASPAFAGVDRTTSDTFSAGIDAPRTATFREQLKIGGVVNAVTYTTTIVWTSTEDQVDKVVSCHSFVSSAIPYRTASHESWSSRNAKLGTANCSSHFQLTIVNGAYYSHYQYMKVNGYYVISKRSTDARPEPPEWLGLGRRMHEAKPPVPTSRACGPCHARWRRRWTG